MKKMKMFALMLLAGVVFFSSCSSDDETGPAPTISFSNFPAGNYEIDFATVATFDLSFAVIITAEEQINTLSAKRKVGGTTVNITPAPTGFAGQTSFTYNFLGTFNETDTYPIELIFSVTDKADQTTEKTFTVTKKAPTQQETPFATEITTGKVFHILAPEMASWNLAGDVAVGSANTTDSYIRNMDAAGSFTGKFESKNGTQFVKVTLNYATASKEAAEAAYAAGTPAGSVAAVAVNDVFVAKKGTELYLIKVTNISTTDGASTAGNKGSMSFSYKK